MLEPRLSLLFRLIVQPHCLEEIFLLFAPLGVVGCRRVGHDALGEDRVSGDEDRVGEAFEGFEAGVGALVAFEFLGAGEHVAEAELGFVGLAAFEVVVGDVGEGPEHVAGVDAVFLFLFVEEDEARVGPFAAFAHVVEAVAEAFFEVQGFLVQAVVGGEVAEGFADAADGEVGGFVGAGGFEDLEEEAEDVGGLVVEHGDDLADVGDELEDDVLEVIFLEFADNGH